MSGRKDRSRSPMRVGRRRDKDKVGGGNVEMQGNNMMAQPMMMSNMYPQGNMMMPGGMYQNMMMPNMMGGGMMPSTGMEMIPSGGNMEMMAPAPMDMSGINSASAMGTTPASMDMGMMGGMMMDPGVMGNMGMYQGGDMGAIIEKREITLKHCKLIPPEHGAEEPPRRPKPPGCRTIFVGGLPDNITEKIVREIFENYGRIHILRLSTKNFCHIRFDKESCVEPAMSLSGYRIKLLNKDGEEEDNSKANSGKLHVDYALSRDDQNEFERRQRQAMRMQEAQMQQITAQQQALQMASGGSMYRRSPSPPRLQPFTNASIGQLVEKIKSEDQFAIALPTLISWLERGECSKKNSNQFYSMIQATNSHIRRLFNEKMQSEEELVECRERVKNQIASVIEQLEQVAKVFAAATHQRVWDHFTKPQRKNIETWQKMSQEFYALKEEFNEKYYGSGEEDANNGYNNMNSNANAITMMDESDEVKRLKLENDSLKFQLEAYKNEVEVIKTDSQKEFEKFKAQFIARQALQGAFEAKPPLPTPVLKPPPPPPLPDDLDAKVNIKECIDPGCGEAKLIGVMSAFLQVHPQGASLDYVVSYVRGLFPQISQASVHQVLQKHEDVFKKTTTGVGANIEHRWSFVAFQNTET